ncbi:MAG: transglycosylase SLT domain-containing protein, partial [Marmoricola sp.]|nr:transglycosylase SLT domain-containing protein [Marmoricola sp.]
GTRWRVRALAVVTATVVGLGTLAAAPASAAPWPGHPDRSLVRYVVRSGDTATGLAVRYHAWTAELISLNHLGSSGALHQGQTIEIPVVLSAVRGHAPRKKHPRQPPLINPTTPPRGWRDANLSRDQVRSLVARMAQHYGVPPVLALAIAWQESGWQQRRVSQTGAIGVMQVMPGTGQWMRWYAGRPLRLRDTHDNIQAGVLTLRTLRSWTKRDVTAIAAYYQGLRSVRHRGWFDDTKLYVSDVLAHEQRLARGLQPR